jgi:hypothetical protein
VSFWSRIRGRPKASETREGDATDEATPAERPELERLFRLGTAGGPDAAEASSLFRALRSTPDEGRAIDVVASVAKAGGAPERLVVAAAAALADRGERDRALELVTGATAPCASLEARMLAADLREARGELTEALALVERVLVRDLDYPGARERHVRWRGRLGLQADVKDAAVDLSAATVVSREPDAPFLLLREVARGGAGAVYEAQDRELGRRVALKVYHHADRDRAQLLHEARVAATLAGPNVVRVLDVDPERGWLALEWAALGSLRQRLRDSDHAALAPLRAWVSPLASALARVHAGGWVHHDVKPANVLFEASGERGAVRPVLADFGTARRTGEPSPPGSLGYVSPERLAGRASDPRDDVFGFGRILEDVLHALSATENAEAAGWQGLAAACTGPDAARPADGRALVTRLRVEAP